MAITHKKGSLLVITTGEYSDYSINDVYLVLRGFDLRKFADEWHKKIPATQRYPGHNWESKKPVLDKPVDFIYAMMKAKLIAKYERARELNLDSHHVIPKFIEEGSKEI